MAKWEEGNAPSLTGRYKYLLVQRRDRVCGVDCLRDLAVVFEIGKVGEEGVWRTSGKRSDSELWVKMKGEDEEFQGGVDLLLGIQIGISRMKMRLDWGWHAMCRVQQSAKSGE